MLTASTAFHNAIKQHNPRERALFVFHDPSDPHPTVSNTAMVWTSTDINARTPITVVESVNTDSELYIGQAPSATLSCEIFNTGGRLDTYIASENNYTNDCTAYLGVETATGSLQVFNASGANCAATIRLGGSSGIVITGHDTAPYLRINGQDIPYDTPLPSNLQWPVKAIIVDNDAGGGDWGYVLALGQNAGQYYAIKWEYGETWGDVNEGFSSWGELNSLHYTWGDLFGTAYMGGTGGTFTFSTSQWMYYYKFPQFAEEQVGYSRVGNTIYEYIHDGNGGFIENKWEYLPIGTFRMDAPSVIDEQTCVFNAYDKMTLFDVNIADFLDNETFPTTLGLLFYDLCEYIGVGDASQAFTNFDLYIASKPDLPNSTTGRSLLRYIAEAACCNARMTRTGEIELISPSFTPAFDVDPTADPHISIFETHIASYNVGQITALSIENPQDDGDPVTVTVGNGDNVYRLTSNPFLQDDTTAHVTSRITPIYNKLAAYPAYTPLQLRCVCDWSVQAGDCVRLYYTRNGAQAQSTFLVPVFAQTIRFSGFAQTTYESRGSATRPADGYASSAAAQVLAQTRSTVSKMETKSATYLTKTGTAYQSASIPFGQVDDTSTSTVFTATVPGVTELRDGVCVYLRNGVVTSASGFTLNINNLGAKPCYSSMAAASRSTTIFNVAYTFLFVYNSSRVDGGCWDIYYGYNSDTNTIAYNIRRGQSDSVMASKLYRYQMVFTKRDGTLLPANGVSNSRATTKTLTTDAFDPYRPIYYYTTTTAIDPASSPSASYLYEQYNAVDLRYGFNAGETLTALQDVYLKCAPQTDGTLKLAGNDCVVQALPSTADGLVYLYLGRAYSAYQISLDIQHPMYAIIGGVCKPWHGETIDTAAASL